MNNMNTYMIFEKDFSQHSLITSAPDTITAVKKMLGTYSLDVYGIKLRVVQVERDYDEDSWTYTDKEEVYNCNRNGDHFITGNHKFYIKQVYEK